MEVFYLKINQQADMTWHYLKMWLDIIEQFPDAKTYIVCDNPILINNMPSHIPMGDIDLNVISSARDSEEMKYIVDNAIVKVWQPAAYAHLTTFLHARDNGYKNFWNIDADDIGLYAKPRRIAKLLKHVKNYSSEREIKAFSIDIWRTLELGNHWSFGLVYTDNSINWIELLKNHCKDKNFFDTYENVHSKRNIDWYFTYLREIGAAKIETFCVENLRMVHHTNQGYTISINGLKYWKGGKCYFPILCDSFNMGEAGFLPIPDDIINFDIGITAEESICFLKNQCIDRFLPVIEKINGIVDAKISVILPLNGAVNDVRFCLESLLAQDFKDFRLIVTDAGLADNALKTCLTLENNFEGRMKILTGVPKEKLLDAGLKAAKGRYVIFITGGDIFIPDTLRFLHSTILIARADFLRTSNYFLRIGENKIIKTAEDQGWNEKTEKVTLLKKITDKLDALSKNLSMSIYNKLIRRGFLEEEKISLPYDTDITRWIFSLQCLCLSEKYVRVSQPLYTRLIKRTTKKISGEDFEINIQSIFASKAALEKIIDEVLYFNEYADEKNFLVNIYEKTLATVQKNL